MNLPEINYLCHFEPTWYSISWIPILVEFTIIVLSFRTLFLNRIFLFQFKNPRIPALYLLITACICRLSWYIDFMGCNYIFDHKTREALLRFSQCLWLQVYAFIMLFWHKLLHLILIGKNVGACQTKLAISFCLSCFILTIVLLATNQSTALGIIFIILVGCMMITGLCSGIPVIRAMHQLLPIQPPAVDHRTKLLRRTQITLGGTLIVATMLIILTTCKYVYRWNVDHYQPTYFCFLILIHCVCEPIIAYLQYYALYFRKFNSMI